MASLEETMRTARTANVQRLRRLNSFTRMLSNPAILAERINTTLAKEGHLDQLLAKRFATAGASQGENWRPLAPATVKQRARLGFGGSSPILVRSGMLQRAAVEGRTKVTADRIVKEFKDGPAPRYVGEGKARKRRLKRAAVRASKFLGVRIGSTGRLSDYAGALNAVRPFYGPPTNEELAPLLRRRDELIAEAVRRMTQGESLTGFI